LKVGFAGRLGDGRQHGHGYATHRDFKRAPVLNGPDIFGHFVFDFGQLNLQGDDSGANMGKVIVYRNKFI
jgi:hypothetical protein